MVIIDRPWAGQVAIADKDRCPTMGRLLAGSHRPLGNRCKRLFSALLRPMKLSANRPSSRKCTSGSKTCANTATSDVNWITSQEEPPWPTAFQQHQDDSQDLLLARYSRLLQLGKRATIISSAKLEHSNASPKPHAGHWSVEKHALAP